jgi:hypothetical protein
MQLDSHYAPLKRLQTKSIGWLVRQGANRSDTVWYRANLQRGMTDKDAISCQGFGGTQH